MSDELVDEIMYMFDFCTCGAPDVFAEQLYEYLKIVESRTVPDDTYIAYMYLADKAGLTEHGGSVFGAWLTIKGEKLLERMKEYHE